MDDKDRIIRALEERVSQLEGQVKAYEQAFAGVTCRIAEVYRPAGPLELSHDDALRFFNKR